MIDEINIKEYNNVFHVALNLVLVKTISGNANFACVMDISSGARHRGAWISRALEYKLRLSPFLTESLPCADPSTSKTITVLTLSYVDLP